MTEAQKLRRIISDAGWSRARAAQVLECEVQTIGRYMMQALHDDGNKVTGQRRQPPSSLVKLASIAAAVGGAK